MGFDLGALLRNAAGPAADVMAAHKRRDASLAEKKQQLALQAVAAQRQASQDALSKAIGESTIGLNDARAFAARNPAQAAHNIDPNSAEGIAAAIAKATGSRAPEKPQAPLFGTPEWNKADIERQKNAAKYGYHPPAQDNFTPVTDYAGGEGTPPVVKPFSTKTGKLGESIATGKAPVTKIESAMNTSAKARLEAAVSEMNNAHDGMDEFEVKLANGTANINGLQQFAGRMANSFTHDDPLSMTAQSSMLALLNRQNPELARYIRRALSFAEGESMISQRPSDFRTKMSAFLSQAASGASPEMIHDIQSRRTSILDPLNRNVVVPPKGGGRGGGAGATGGATGPIDLGEEGWAKANPPRAGESFDQYHARYLASKGGE